MNSVLVVIPTYNEKDNVRNLVQAVEQSCPAADLLFVDDNSPDDTGQILDGLAAADARVHVLHRPKKQGLGRAYLAGFKWALAQPYEWICEMDADFSHDPADLPHLLAAAQTADLALGSRYVGGVRVMNWPMSRLLLSKGAALYTQWITGLPVMDPTGGFKCFEGQSKMNAQIVREARWMVWKLLLRARGRRRPRGVHPRSVSAAGGVA
ncbi:MAG: polyprenol monophosphomannose synthase [Kiritimatiellaeota bacterium]|nr:polyprenol monophosphomannose synthase [Kiritimatiellota bacterium]